MGKNTTNDWRNDEGLQSDYHFKKRFAFFPAKLKNGDIVWFKTYYLKYQRWFSSFESDLNYHIDFLGRISSEEYLVIILSQKR